ncbi:MAG TPA: hypothetical protein GX516_00605 [Thermoanaerobacter sp.]|nr:hypothetical protein [Thermoanaerobacter sp.]
MEDILEKNEVLIWGAGKIGRGFLAEIFTDAGYHVTFIEYDEKLVNDLKETKSYTIYKALKDDQYEVVKIKNYEVLSTKEEDIITKKVMDKKHVVMAIAVHQSGLPSVIKIISEIVIKKAYKYPQSTLDVILCVNMLNVAQYCQNLFEKYLPINLHSYLNNNIGLVESVVMRIATQPTQEMLKEDKLAVLTNGYDNMPVDKKAFKGPIPKTKMLKLSDNIIAEEIRKFYTLNMSHALLAYIGFSRGYKYAHEAIQDKDIYYVITQALKEVGEGLIKEYEFTKEEIEKWNEEIVDLLKNPLLNDTLSRLGSDTKRKLSKQDRLVGPSLLCLKHGITPFYLAHGIAYGFKFSQSDDEGTEEVQIYLKEYGIDKALRKICDIQDDNLISLIKEIYEEAVPYNKILVRQ